VANLPAATAAVLATLVYRLSPEPTTTASMAEVNTQPPARGPSPTERKHHDTLAVDNSSQQT